VRSNVKLVEPAAAVDWSVFRVEGDSYLRRLGIPDDIAIWLAAKLYLTNWASWQRGGKWDEKRALWLKEGAWQSKRGNNVVDPRTGKMVPPCMAPSKCQRCGDWCTQTARVCGACWTEIRPRKRARRGLQLDSPTSCRQKPADDGMETYRVTRPAEISTPEGRDEVGEQVRSEPKASEPDSYGAR